MKNIAKKMKEIADLARTENKKQAQAYVESYVLPIIERTARKGECYIHLADYEYACDPFDVAEILCSYGFSCEVSCSHITILW